MKLSDINKSGEGAARLIRVVSNIKTFANTHSSDYDTALASARTSFSLPTLTFLTMTDAQINTFFLGGLGDIAAIATAKNVIGEWELLIKQIKKSADKFVNDI